MYLSSGFQTLHEIHISPTHAASLVHLIILVHCNVRLRCLQADSLCSMADIRDVYLEGTGFKTLTLRLIIQALRYLLGRRPDTCMVQQTPINSIHSGASVACYSMFDNTNAALSDFRATLCKQNFLDCWKSNLRLKKKPLERRLLIQLQYFAKKKYLLQTHINKKFNQLKISARWIFNASSVKVKNLSPRH